MKPKKLIEHLENYLKEYGPEIECISTYSSFPGHYISLAKPKP